MHGVPGDQKKRLGVQRMQGPSSSQVEPGGELGEIEDAESWSLRDDGGREKRVAPSTPAISFEEFRKQQPEEVLLPEGDEVSGVELDYPSDGMSAVEPEIQVNDE
jgi:hypothetical protein